MKLLKNGFLAFDYVLPVYNWFFPCDLHPSYVSDFSALEQLSCQEIKKRALYFHIPFCEDICSFCPFKRSIFRDKEEIERYVQALIKEIQVKSRIKSAELIEDDGDIYTLTQLGWYWYVNLFYYLSTKKDREAIDEFIAKCSNENMRQVEDCHVNLSF